MLPSRVQQAAGSSVDADLHSQVAGGRLSGEMLGHIHGSRSSPRVRPRAMNVAPTIGDQRRAQYRQHASG